MSQIIGSVVEAWGQVRIAKLRVLLSLVGVAVAVACMTFVIAFGQVSVQIIQEGYARYVGQPGTLSVNVTPTKPDVDGATVAGDSTQSGGGAASGDPGAANKQTDKIVTAMETFVERYQVSHSAITYEVPFRMSLPDGPEEVRATVITEGYQQIHRAYADQGRWFTRDDADDLSPSLVVSKSMLKRLGIEELTAPVTIQSYAPVRATFTIVGVLPPEPGSQSIDEDGNLLPEPLTAFVLRDALEPVLPKDFTRPAPTLKLWVGKDGDAKMRGLARDAFNAQFGSGSAKISSNLDNSGGIDSANGFTRVVTIAGLIVMALGALSLVNISLVTVRQRINEIGVRRSFGATNGRIFFSIMMESVVATVLAGIVGIAIAIVGMPLVPFGMIFGLEPVTPPVFPMTAALIGLLSATGVGALAGLIPGIVAMRIRPIDAIRY